MVTEYYNIRSFEPNCSIFIMYKEGAYAFNEDALYIAHLTGLKLSGKPIRVYLEKQQFDYIKKYLDEEEITYIISDNGILDFHTFNNYNHFEAIKPYLLDYRLYMISQLLFKEHKELDFVHSFI